MSFSTMNIKHKQSGQVFEIGAYYPKRPGSSLHRFFKIEDGRILQKTEGYLGFGGTGHTLPANPGKFIGTFQTGPYVFHVFKS